VQLEWLKVEKSSRVDSQKFVCEGCIRRPAYLGFMNIIPDFSVVAVASSHVSVVYSRDKYLYICCKSAIDQNKASVTCMYVLKDQLAPCSVYVFASVFVETTCSQLQLAQPARNWRELELNHRRHLTASLLVSSLNCLCVGGSTY
jgi:hypothetical protein